MKKNIIFLILLVILTVSLYSCESTASSQVDFLEDLICCNVTESGGKFGFVLRYVYKDKQPEIEFVSFNDEVADSVFVNMADETISLIADKKADGYKMAALGFSLDMTSLPAGKSLSIDSITLLVSGSETILNTKGRILYNKVASNDERYSWATVSPTNVPVVVFSRGDGIEAIPFYFVANDTVEIRGFEFNDFVTITRSMVYIDGDPIGSIESALPITVERGKTILFEIDGEFLNHDPFSDFYLNCLLSYYTPQDGEKCVKDYFAIQAVGNYEDMKNLIHQKYTITQE